VARVQRGKLETPQLGLVAHGVDAEDHREGCVRLAQRADAAEGRDGGARDGREQAPPRKDDRHAIGDAGQLRRELLDGRAYVEDVRAGARGASAEVGRVRVYSDEETLGRVTRQRAGQPAVTGADVDRDSAREAGDEISESVIGALEALAADDVHGVSMPEARAKSPPPLRPTAGDLRRVMQSVPRVELDRLVDRHVPPLRMAEGAGELGLL